MDAAFASRLKPLASPAKADPASVAAPRAHRRSVTEYSGQPLFPVPADGVAAATASASAAAAPAPAFASPTRPKHTRSLSDTSLVFSPNSPVKQDIYSDRYIPSRVASRLDTGLVAPSPQFASENSENRAEDQVGSTYHMLIRSELLPDHEARPTPVTPTHRQPVGSPTASAAPISFSSPTAARTLRFKAPLQSSILDEVPLSAESRQLLNSPTKAVRKIAKQPFKVLDAPALQDDFYLNLVDWSAQNVLAVGLGPSVYLWAANTGKVTRLCDLTDSEDSVSSLAFTNKGQHVAVGTKKGLVQIWDAARCQRLRTMDGHGARVSSLAWASSTLASGSRDQHIYLRDVRSPQSYYSQLSGHRQEVCGLRWSFDEQQLASGGNDNKLCIWTQASTSPLFKFSEHQAAVKALAWSPHQSHLLASGGGTADRHIRFWNTQTGTQVSSVDTGSQVCNLMWSKTCNELISTHGYSLNQIIVWKYPTMQKLATLTGHTYRVLFLAMSPDGQNIVTGAGDETLRFWNVFPPPKNKSGSFMDSKLTSGVGVADIR